MTKGHKQLKLLYKKIILFTAAFLCIVLFFTLPRNYEWLQSRIVAPLYDFKQERHNLDETYRMQYRFDSTYIYSQQIAHALQQKGAGKNTLVLMPSTDYFKIHGISYHVPEPVVFYYFTGVKTLWANCLNAADANWYATVNNGKIVIDTVASRQALADTITAFKKYNIGL